MRLARFMTVVLAVTGVIVIANPGEFGFARAHVASTAIGLPPHQIPFFPSASDADGRQGFARIVNHSAQSGDVIIRAIDDVGGRYGPLTLTLDRNETVHVNSEDLETGNVAKGLSGRTGRGEGDWRLELTSELDIEVLAYVRASDGFLMAMHDVAPRRGDVYRVVIFNPGSNDVQKSLLRLVNPGQSLASVTITGTDDLGVSSVGSVTVEVPPGEARTFTAAQLEEGSAPELEGSLGDGSGRWRLDLKTSQMIIAMSLLSSPTGDLTNLSAVPSSESGRVHLVPLFPAASDPHGRQGFVRVVNRSDTAGAISIAAFDETDREFDELTLSVQANQTSHFNSRDLELGNAAKGLVGGTGSGEGHWRLKLTSDLDIEVLSYIRTADGFLTSMHDVVPSKGGTRHRVATFNPGSNRSQQSLLRLVNDGADSTMVAVRGIDDHGVVPGTDVRVLIPAGSSKTLTAHDLEAGSTDFEGSLGDGSGRWSLDVESDRPITVMGLLSSPTGHLTNLSTVPGKGVASSWFPRQKYIESTDLPRWQIERAWSRDYYITSVVRDDDHWIVVMSRSPGAIDGQSIHVSASFPGEGIEEAWDNDERITEVAHGNGTWLVVTSSGTGFGGQRWYLRSDFPDEEIRESRSDDLHITDIAYGNGTWALVASGVKHYKEQSYATDDISDFITRHWNQDYMITEATSGDGMLIVVATRTGHRWYQGTQRSRLSNLPTEIIHEAWSDGRDIAETVHLGDGYWIVSSGGLDNVKGFAPPILPSGGTLKTEVQSWSARSAEVVIDLFAVDSRSQLLSLSEDDFAIASFQLGDGEMQVDFTQTGVERVAQSYVGPYSAAFLFDQSGSITNTDPADSRIDAAQVFMRNLGSGDEVGLLAFAKNGKLPHSPVTAYNGPNGKAFTSDPHGFDAAFRKLADQEDGGTPLYDAIGVAVRYTVSNADNANRVVIVFTDGQDTASSASLDDAVRVANQHNVPLHTVALASGVDMSVLSDMAGRTGGALARASDAKRLISYYGSLGPYLSGTAVFYRTTWQVSFMGGRGMGTGGWMTSCVRVSIPGGTMCVPFRLDFN